MNTTIPHPGIGTKAKINISQESRDWGYNPAPNGEEVEIVGFSIIDWGRINGCCHEPGMFYNNSWPTVRFADGREQSISSCHLTFPNRDWVNWPSVFVSELPELPFWELDVIRVVGGRFSDYREWKYITNISYRDINKKCNDGSPYPMYSISPDESGGCTTYASQEELELVERGKVWKFYHNEPIAWETDKEEIEFYYKLGRYQEIRNPANSLYSWDIKEAVAAAKDGLVDCSRAIGYLFMGGSGLGCIKFTDERISEKARRMFLQNFSYTG